MKLIVDNANTLVEFSEPQEKVDKINEYLYDKLSADIPGAQYSPSYRRNQWDGKTHFYNKNKHTFATGLLEDVTKLLNDIRFNYEFTYDVFDNRPDAFVDADTIPDDLSVEASDGTYKLRDYQVDAVKAVFKSGHGGIVNATVSSGKTLIGATIIRQIIPKLQRGERIGFFTNNSEIFKQSITNLNKFLPEKVGYLGNGKSRVARIMVCMIPTIDSYLKIDPEHNLSLTPKEQQIKKLAHKYRDKLLGSSNPYQELKTLASVYKPLKKVDIKTKELLEDARDECGTSQDVINLFNSYLDKYNQIVNKKNGDLVKKKKFIDELLDSFVLVVADECVTGDTHISTVTGDVLARDLNAGTRLTSGKVTAISRTDKQPVYELVADTFSIKGSITHPVAVWTPDKEDHILYKPMFSIKSTDFVIAPSEHIGLHRVKYVRPTGKYECLYDIETSSHTYTGNGLLMHNCHHTKSDTWYKVLLSCNNAVYKVGLSGSINTDDALTWSRLRGVFGGIATKVRAKQLIDRGLIAKPTIIMIPINAPEGIKSMSSSHGQWQQVYKLGIVDNEYRNKIIAALTKKQYDDNKTTLIIVNQISQADNISKILDSINIPHEFIYGDQDSDVRTKELDRVKDNKNKVLLATSVLDEGVDIANINTLILAAGGKSQRQVIQRIGRVLRKKKTGDNKATIFDFMDNTNYVLKNHSEERLALYKEQEFDVKFAGKD